VAPTKDDVVEVLRQVEDPELGMDVVELGLVYDVEIEGGSVKVIHTLTSMGCPVGPMIQQNLDDVVRAMPGVEDVQVELTWDPPWTPDRMSEDAKFILGFG
jgi:metal-sulfur cluster biosynthetic enzyme